MRIHRYHCTTVLMPINYKPIATHTHTRIHIRMNRQSLDCAKIKCGHWTQMAISCKFRLSFSVALSRSFHLSLSKMNGLKDLSVFLKYSLDCFIFLQLEAFCQLPQTITILFYIGLFNLYRMRCVCEYVLCLYRILDKCDSWIKHCVKECLYISSK